MPDLNYPHEIVNDTLPDADQVQENFDAVKALIENLGIDNLAAAIQAKFVPPGALLDFAGAAAPTGFLLCDGSVISRTTYADLFAAIGTTYNTGGEAGTDFRLPDFRGRVAMAPDGGASRIGSSPDTLGGAGGSERVTLTAAESGMPAHNPVITDNGHFHSVDRSGSNNQVFASLAGASPGDTMGLADADGAGLGGLYAEVATTGITAAVAAAAAASSHQNLPPYLVVNKIVKV
jgi:microcystin-dependent protein